MCYRASLSEARRRLAMNQLALCLGYTHLIWYAANRCGNGFRIRPYKQYKRYVIEEQHKYHGNKVFRVIYKWSGETPLISISIIGILLSRLLTNTQLHDVGIVGPADNGQDEDHGNPLKHSHATAARCRLPPPVVVVAHARV